jgi:hypothetical protein
MNEAADDCDICRQSRLGNLERENIVYEGDRGMKYERDAMRNV